MTVSNKRTERRLSLNVDKDAWIRKLLSSERKLLPPDHYGWNAMYAARAQKVLDFYQEMDPELERQSLLWSLLSDLLHLCDREAELGDLDEQFAAALYFYAECIWETSSVSELARLVRRL